VPAARTATFAFLAIGQLFYAYPSRRSEGRPLRNPWVHWAVAASLALQLLVLGVPWLRAAFDTVPLAPRTIALVVAAAAVSWLAAELIARFSWRAVRPR